MSALRPDEMSDEGKRLQSAERRGALRRARDLARQASEIASALARLDLADSDVAPVMQGANRAWAGLHGHDDLPAIALGEIVLLIAGPEHQSTGSATVAECAQETLAAIHVLWPEYAQNMNVRQLEAVIADWAEERRNAGKWKSTAALLRDAGVRKSNPKNGAEVVRVEFQRWTRGQSGRSVTKRLKRQL